MTQTLSEQVAATIRAECARARISQSQLADLLGLSQAAVSRRFAGSVPFELDELEKVAGLLTVAPADLMGRAA